MAVGVFGFWLGEGGSPSRETVPLAMALIACIVAGFIMPGKPWHKVLAGFASLALLSMALVVGSLSFTRAFNECIATGEVVRTRLSEYRQQNNQYPNHLGRLEGLTPCWRILRPSILAYEKTADGYVISFKDWLVEYRATESESFMALK